MCTVGAPVPLCSHVALTLGNRSCRCIAEGKIPRYQQPPSTKLPVLLRSWRSLSCFVLIFLYSRSLPILVQYIEFYTNRSSRPPTTKGDGKESGVVPTINGNDNLESIQYLPPLKSEAEFP